jgi:hypothetical protein
MARKLLAASIGIAAASIGCANDRTVGNAMGVYCPNNDCGYEPYDTAPPACPWPDPPSGVCAFSQHGIGYEPVAGACTYDEVTYFCGVQTVSKNCHCVDVADGGQEWSCTSKGAAACACAVDAGGGADVFEAGDVADVEGDVEAMDATVDAEADAGPGCDEPDGWCGASGFYTRARSARRRAVRKRTPIASPTRRAEAPPNASRPAEPRAPKARPTRGAASIAASHETRRRSRTRICAA